MKNKPLVLVLVGAVVFGLLAAISVSKYISGAEAGSSDGVVVAKLEVPLGTVLNAEQLTTAQIGKGSAPEKSFTKIEDVVGRVVINTVGPREPITEYRLAPKGSLAGLAALIPEGYRAMTIHVDDEAGVAGLLSPGMLVDVLTIINPPEGMLYRSDPISKVVLQNVKVLATGTNLEMPKDQAEASNVRSITLLVTPDQAEQIVLSGQDAKIRLIVRGYTDQTNYETTGKRKSSLLMGMPALPVPNGSAAEPNPLRRPAPPAPRPLSAIPATIPMAYLESRKAAPVPTPVPPRNSIEVFDGGKKRNVDFY